MSVHAWLKGFISLKSFWIFVQWIRRYRFTSSEDFSIGYVLILDSCLSLLCLAIKWLPSSHLYSHVHQFELQPESYNCLEKWVYLVNLLFEHAFKFFFLLIHSETKAVWEQTKNILCTRCFEFFISPFYYYMYRNLTCIMRYMENTQFLLEVWKTVGEKQYLLPKLREHHTKEQFLSIFYSFAGLRRHYLKCLAGFVFSSILSPIQPFSPAFAIFLVFPHWHAYKREDIDM